MNSPLQTAYTVFWLYKADRRWREQPENVRQRAQEEFIATLESPDDNAWIRAVYSTVGFRHDVDTIIWAVGLDAGALQRVAVRINRTAVGGFLDMRQAYLGIASASQYDPTHGPAFLKGIPPRRYLSIYPFTKTPEWYILPFEKRRELMSVHGGLGDEFPTILTNTVSSFGIQDQEFIVALEDDDPHTLVRMVQRLRAAEVRVYTQVDTPIFLGQLKSPAEVLADLG